MATKPTRNAKYQPFPDLPPKEFASLKADIEVNGLLCPVIEDEKGNTLDGHQRKRALAELGIVKFPTRVLSGLSDIEKWFFALSTNVKRRHLNTSQKRKLIEEELKRHPEIANNWHAENLGVDDKTVLKVRRKLESTSEIPKLKKLKGKDGKRRKTRYSSVIANSPKEIEQARIASKSLQPNGRIMDTVTASRQARRNAKTTSANGKPVKSMCSGSIKIFNCRFQDLEKVAGLKKNSASLILTDPPYDKNFISQLPELASFARRVLKPGGVFVSYFGSYYLPNFMEALSQELTYRWLAVQTWNGSANMIYPLNLASQSKPILIYSKGDWKKRDRWNDVFNEDVKEKEFHPHQQPLAEFERLVSYFSEQNDLIVDCCAGSFGTAVACKNLGRKFVGCDIEAKHVVAGKIRIK